EDAPARSRPRSVPTAPRSAACRPTASSRRAPASRFSRPRNRRGCDEKLRPTPEFSCATVSVLVFYGEIIHPFESYGEEDARRQDDGGEETRREAARGTQGGEEPQGRPQD